MTPQTRAGYSTKRLLREFDHGVTQVNPVLQKYYGLDSEAIIQDARLEFEQAMDEHAKKEFPMLRDLLRRSKQSSLMAT